MICNKNCSIWQTNPPPPKKKNDIIIHVEENSLDNILPNLAFDICRTRSTSEIKTK